MMKKVFKKTDLNKIEKAILVKFAEAVELKAKTKKSIVDTLGELTFDENKDYGFLDHTFLITNNFVYLMTRNKDAYSFETNMFSPQIMAAFYEAGYIMGYRNSLTEKDITFR